MSSVNSFLLLENLTANATATETAVANPAAPTTRQLLGLGTDVAGGFFDGKPFKVRVIAQGVASGAGNFVVNLYWNSGANTGLTTFTSDILLIGSGNQALASKSGVVTLAANVIWDSTSQQIATWWDAAAGISNIPTTPALTKSTASVGATNPVATAIVAQSSLQFFITTSVSANGTSAKILEFSAERI